ncbi:MAG: hypothetical protein ACOVOR_01600 [Rhabdochlamydiaceae bacterium]
MSSVAGTKPIIPGATFFPQIEPHSTNPQSGEETVPENTLSSADIIDSEIAINLDTTTIRTNNDDDNKHEYRELHIRVHEDPCENSNNSFKTFTIDDLKTRIANIQNKEDTLTLIDELSRNSISLSVKDLNEMQSDIKKHPMLDTYMTGMLTKKKESESKIRKLIEKCLQKCWPEKCCSTKTYVNCLDYIFCQCLSDCACCNKKIQACFKKWSETCLCQSLSKISELPTVSAGYSCFMMGAMITGGSLVLTHDSQARTIGLVLLVLSLTCPFFSKIVNVCGQNTKQKMDEKNG